MRLLLQDINLVLIKIMLEIFLVIFKKVFRNMIEVDLQLNKNQNFFVLKVNMFKIYINLNDYFVMKRFNKKVKMKERF